MIRLERTSNRKVQHLFIQQLYVGAIENGEITVVPHLEPVLDRIKENLSARFRGMPVKVGIPCAHMLPWAYTPATSPNPKENKIEPIVERTAPPAKKAAKKTSKKAAKKKTTTKRKP